MPVCRACNEYRGNCSAIEEVTGAISAYIAPRGRGLIAPASGTRIYRCFLMLHDDAGHANCAALLRSLRWNCHALDAKLSAISQRSIIDLSDGERFISEAEFKLTQISLE